MREFVLLMRQLLCGGGGMEYPDKLRTALAEHSDTYATGATLKAARAVRSLSRYSMPPPPHRSCLMSSTKSRTMLSCTEGSFFSAGRHVRQASSHVS